MERMHWLPFCGKVFLFKCKSSSVPKDRDRNGTEVSFSGHLFQQTTNTFQKTNDGVSVISRTTLPDVDIMTCNCVLDVRTRATKPCILLSQGNKGASFQYRLLILGSSNRLETHKEFKLQYQMTENVSIVHGPRVIWTHGGAVFYTSLVADEVKQVPVQFSCLHIGQLPLHNEKLFILGLGHPCQKDRANSSDEGQALGYFLDGGQTFDGTLMLPHAYISITLCMLVLSAEQVHGALRTSVVAATRNQQLVYFESGIPRASCRLPFEGPRDIQLVDTGRNGRLFTVSFHQGHACAIRQDTFQVATCWSGLSSLHVDDFLGCGTDQMLLVYGDRAPTAPPLDHFLITDLCGTTYSHGVESGGRVMASVPAQDNYQLTVQALESRLQSGLGLLQDLQRDVEVKHRVLMQSLQAFTDVAAGKEPVVTQYEQEGLTTLWDDDDDEQHEEDAKDETCEDAPTASSKPHVVKLWHRIAEDRLVVGVMLTTDSTIPADSLSLSVLTEGSQSPAPAVMQTHSRVSWLPSPGTATPQLPPPSPPTAHPEPAAKRSRQDRASGRDSARACQLAVTGVTSLTPLLNPGGVKCPVVLHYLPGRGSSSAPVNELLSTATLLCGRVPVAVQTLRSRTRLLSDSGLTTDEAQEDFLGLLAVLDRWVFQVDSPDRGLGDIEGWIQRTQGCERLKVSPQYLLSNPGGLSEVLLLRWKQKTPFQGELSVHCSQLRMLQFLDALLSFLPTPCSIHPIREQETEGSAQHLALALEREVLSLREGLSSLLDEEEEEEVMQTEEVPGPSSMAELQRCREEWQRDLKRSRRRLSPLVDVRSYRRLSQSLARAQLEGDMAALLETQRAPFTSNLD